MAKEAPAVLRRKGVEGAGQSCLEILQGSGRCLAQMRFEFGKSLFNGVEIGAVRRQVADRHSARREQPADILDFVSGEVVEDERVPCAQLRTEYPFQIDREHLGIDGAFNQKGGFDTFVAQRRQEGGTLPVTVGNDAQTSLADQTTPTLAGQRGV